MTISRCISEIYRCAMLFRNAEGQEIGMSGHLYPYILKISHHSGVRQEELARHLHVNKSNVTRAVAKLEEDGFVVKKADQDDKRAVRVYLTPKGEKALPKIRAVLRQWNEYLSAPFANEKWEEFCQMMYLVNERATSYAKEKEEGICD